MTEIQGSGASPVGGDAWFKSPVKQRAAPAANAATKVAAAAAAALGGSTATSQAATPPPAPPMNSAASSKLANSKGYQPTNKRPEGFFEELEAKTASRRADADATAKETTGTAGDAPSAPPMSSSMSHGSVSRHGGGAPMKRPEGFLEELALKTASRREAADASALESSGEATSADTPSEPPAAPHMSTSDAPSRRDSGVSRSGSEKPIKRSSAFFEELQEKTAARKEAADATAKETMGTADTAPPAAPPMKEGGSEATSGYRPPNPHSKEFLAELKEKTAHRRQDD